MEHEHLDWEDLLLITAGLLESDGELLAEPSRRERVAQSISSCAVCRRLAERSADLPIGTTPVAEPILTVQRPRRSVLVHRALGGALAASLLLALVVGISTVGLSVGITRGEMPVGPVLLGAEDGASHFEMKSAIEDLGTITLSPRSRLRVHAARFHPGDEIRSTIELENGDVDLRLPAGGRARIKLVSPSGSAIVAWSDMDDGEADGLHLRIAESEPGDRPDLDDITLQVVRGDITVFASDSLVDRGLALTNGDRARFSRNGQDEIVAHVIGDAE